MPTAVTYSRYSSSMQHESSIEAQQDAIAIYAAKHGITIVRQYADRARSGTNDNRPEFQRMIADLRTDPVDLVLIHKIDRFARNRYDAAIYSRLIADRGARLVAVAQDFGDGPESIILEGLMQAMAEYYSLNLSTEIKKGKKVLAKAGKYSGGISPLGYRHDGHGSYVIEPLEAHFVREFYDALFSGRSYADVARRATAAGVTGRLGATLTNRNISQILSNPVYAGIFEASVDGETYRYENHHPAIVTISEYEEACRLIKQNQNVGREAQHHDYLCAGLGFCGCCGARLTGNSQIKRGKLYLYYNCKGRCGLRGLSSAELETAACDYVNALLVPEIRTELAAALRAYQTGQLRASKRRAPGAKKEIAQLRAEIDALVANMSAGVLPPIVLERLGQQIAEKEERIRLLEELSAAPPQFEAAAIDDYFADCAAVSLDGDPEQVQRTLRRFIERITVYPDRMEFSSTLDAWLRAHHPELAAPAHAVVAPHDDDDPDDDPSGPSGSSHSDGSGSATATSSSGSAGTTPSGSTASALSSQRPTLILLPSAGRYSSLAHVSANLMEFPIPASSSSFLFDADPASPSYALSIIFGCIVMRKPRRSFTTGLPVKVAQRHKYK